MKMPKNWNKLKIEEQEQWLVKKYQEMISEVESVSKMLAKIRGGQRIKIAEEVSRPDEALLKS
jgi:beta-mannanase